MLTKLVDTFRITIITTGVVESLDYGLLTKYIENSTIPSSKCIHVERVITVDPPITAPPNIEQPLNQRSATFLSCGPPNSSQ